jgi:hypothetical protein
MLPVSLDPVVALDFLEERKSSCSDHYLVQHRCAGLLCLRVVMKSLVSLLPFLSVLLPRVPAEGWHIFREGWVLFQGRDDHPMLFRLQSNRQNCPVLFHNETNNHPIPMLIEYKHFIMGELQ